MKKPSCWGMGRRQQCIKRLIAPHFMRTDTAARRLARHRRLLSVITLALQLHVTFACLPRHGRTAHPCCAVAWRGAYGVDHAPGLATPTLLVRGAPCFGALRGGGDDADTEGGKEDNLSASQRQEAEKLERDKALIGELQGMRNDRSKLKKRLSMLAEEIQEHAEAARVLEKFDGARPCKRAIGGVLIDSTAGEVLPALHNEVKLLTKASDEISAKLAELESSIDAFSKKHDIRIVSEGFESFG